MEGRLVRLADAMNTYNPALGVIRDKGYHIYLEVDEREGYYGDYWAIQDQRDFVASDPLRLLGLIALWEHLGDDWQQTATDDDLMEQVADVAFVKNDYRDLSDEEFEQLVAHLRLFFDAQGEPLPEQIDRPELARRVKIFNYLQDDPDAD